MPDHFGVAEHADRLPVALHVGDDQHLRVLALAECAWPDARLDEPRLSSASLTFLGIAGMLDPPREEAIAAIASCRGAGVAVKMVTGDHATTAASIAARMNLAGDGAVPAALTGAQVAGISDADLPEIAQECAVIVHARDGVERALKLIAAALPKHLRETCYLCAVEAAAIDGSVPAEELRILQRLRQTLNLDRLVTVALERATQARLATL